MHFYHLCCLMYYQLISQSASGHSPKIYISGFHIWRWRRKLTIISVTIGTAILVAMPPPQTHTHISKSNYLYCSLLYFYNIIITCSFWIIQNVKWQLSKYRRLCTLKRGEYRYNIILHIISKSLQKNVNSWQSPAGDVSHIRGLKRSPWKA